jgi:class 3 adenylate cyclase
VVGDTVNATSRIEALSKDLGLEIHESASECFVLLSETTIEAIDDQSNIESLGPQVLRGRSGEIEVFRLVPGH